MIFGTTDDVFNHSNTHDDNHGGKKKKFHKFYIDLCSIYIEIWQGVYENILVTENELTNNLEIIEYTRC